tara:strand:+ start:461 stop:694 length:234 start_codon:yes stop_codon:yes gene_type:complete
MKYLIIISLMMFCTKSFANSEVDCEGLLAKLKAECNIVGKSMEKMREFSKDNQTLNQVGDNIGKSIGKGVDKLKKNF